MGGAKTTLAFEAYNGSWTTMWSRSGATQGGGNEWKASAPVYLSKSNAQRIRFVGTTQLGDPSGAVALDDVHIHAICTSCAKGQYQGSFGASSCIQCPPGEFCETTGLAEPTGICGLGKFSIGGQIHCECLKNVILLT